MGLQFKISDRNIRKSTSTTYLGVTITSRGIEEDLHIKWGEMMVKIVGNLVKAARLGTKTKWSRAKYLLDTYMRSSYLYNAILRNEKTIWKK